MTRYGQTVISRETRVLLTTIVVAVVALWLLARIRFQERPVTADPVPPVLAQLRPQSSFDDLARLMADMRSVIGAWTFVTEGGYPALRVRQDAAVTLAPVESNLRLAFDSPTGLAVIRIPGSDSPGLLPWVPRVLDYPRYLIAADFTGERLSLRPVFVSGLFPMQSVLWNGDLWQLPDAVAIEPGTFVFTTDGAFAGLAVRTGTNVALVPPTPLLKTVEQMLQRGVKEPPSIGLTVQSLTAPIAAATGASEGMVVTAVDRSGPAAGLVTPTDVIQAVNGRSVPTLDHWRSLVERLSPGETVQLRVRRGGASHDVPVTTAERDSLVQMAPAGDRSIGLGLRLRTLPKIGAEVVAVDHASSAALAGVQPGDVVTVAGSLSTPTAAQVVRAFRDLDADRALLVALRRGDESHVMALRK